LPGTILLVHSFNVASPISLGNAILFINSSNCFSVCICLIAAKSTVDIGVVQFLVSLFNNVTAFFLNQEDSYTFLVKNNQSSAGLLILAQSNTKSENGIFHCEAHSALPNLSSIVLNADVCLLISGKLPNHSHSAILYCRSLNALSLLVAVTNFSAAVGSL